MSTARPFRFGIKVATDPGDIPTREAWITLARKAEDLGYATFSVADHFVNEYAAHRGADVCRRCHQHPADRQLRV